MSFLFQPFPELTTDRLLLRSYIEEDFAQIHYMRSNDTVNQYIKRKRSTSLADAEAFVKNVQQSMREGKNVNWAICHKNDHTMLGSICLWNFSTDQKTGEVGYDLHPDHQKKGIMQEALTRVISYGFDTLFLASIKAYTHHSNLDSLQLLKKNGFITTDEKDVNNKSNMVLALLNSNYSR